MLKELNIIKNEIIKLHEHIKNICDADILDDDKISLIFNKNCSIKVFELCEKIGVEISYSEFSGFENDFNVFLSTLDKVVTYIKEIPSNLDIDSSDLIKDKFLFLVDEINMLNNSKLTAENKYNLIFSNACNKKALEFLSELNLKMEYYEQNTEKSYEEDVIEYVKLINDRAEVIRKVFNKK